MVYIPICGIHFLINTTSCSDCAECGFAGYEVVLASLDILGYSIVWKTCNMFLMLFSAFDFILHGVNLSFFHPFEI